MTGGDERGEKSGRMKWSSPLRVAQCRARCLQTFSGGPSKDAVCLQGPDCFMCWENCELLQSNYAVWGAMCTQKGICFPGCQQACKFHREEETSEGGASRQVEPVVHTLGHQVVQVVMPEENQGGGIPLPLIRWPPYSSRTTRDRNSSVVYVLMTRNKDTLSWTQVTQTVDHEAHLVDSVVAQLDVRVMVVDPEGLVTIYSPAATLGGHSLEKGLPPLYPSSTSTTPSPSTSPSLTKGDRAGAVKGDWPLVIREDVTSPLDNAQLALLFPTASAEQVAAAAAIAERQRLSLGPSSHPGLGAPSSDPWVLHEVSLIHQRVLVIAEVSWEARSVARVYLVTWEVDGGGLKGNLFTHTTCVTLSLWPQTLYHIQVEVVSRTPGALPPPDRSQVLHLDTRRAAPVVLAPDAHQQAPRPVRPYEGGIGTTPQWRPGREMVAGSGAALTIFFLVLAALSVIAAWRRRRPCRSAQLRSSGDKAALEADHEGMGLRGSLLFLFLRSLPEALKRTWARRSERHLGAAAAPGARSIPTVSGHSPHKAGPHQQSQRWPLHPESYADAFLREAERRARNEVQV